MEMADLILVNKADGDLKSQATRTCADYAGALRLLRKRPQDPKGFPKAITVSALEQHGIAAAWDDMQHLAEWRRAQGLWDQIRKDQANHWFTEDLRQGLLQLQLDDPATRARIEAAQDAVASGALSPTAAAAQVLGPLRRN